MISDSKFKLVRRYAPHKGAYPDEFFHLSTDPRETVNRINDPAWQQVIARLGKLLDEHFSRYENPRRSAKTILTQPPCNSSELWRTGT